MKKSFYLTSLFADIKSEHNWSTNEIKVVMLVFSQMSKHRIYVKNKDGTYISQNELEVALKEVPIKYKISKSEFLSITGTRTDNVSREINKVRKSLISKIIHTYHPLEKDNESGESISWFSKITYSNLNGELNIEFNKYAMERLIAFVKYSKISFDCLVKLKSSYSIFTYIFLKIMKDISHDKTINTETLDISEFKEKLFLTNKYKDINLFRSRVLDVIKTEINDNTDLIFNYELLKGNSGKAKKLIKITFDHNPNYIEQESHSLIQTPAIDQNSLESKNSYNSPFQQILVRWNIRAKKVVELEETYSLDDIQTAIDLTLKKENTGEIKTTKAAIFLGILENNQLASDEKFERAKKDIEEQQDKKFRDQVSAEYNKLSSFILSNEDVIKLALTSNTKRLPITDNDAIAVFNRLKNIDADKFRAYTVPILDFYHFESNSNVSSTLSDIVDRSHYIEIDEYKDDMAIVQAYKKALDKIKEDKYITDEQKNILKKEVHETINLLLGL